MPAEIVVPQSLTPFLDRSTDIDVALGILSTGTTVLSVEELARNVAWAVRDAEVGAALDAIVAGDREPDEFLHLPVFVPGSRGGGLPRYTAEGGPHRALRASSVLGASP